MNGSTALYAIVHARYGKKLKNKDYEHLISLKSVPEIVEYLKSNTEYKKVLSTVKGNDIHRGYLEKLIRKQYQDDRNSLAKFEKESNINIYKYTFAKNSSRELLRFIRFFNSGRAKEYILTAPKSQEEYYAVDIAKLTKAESFEDILNAIQDKNLRKILSDKEKFIREDGTFDYPVVEFEIKKYFIDLVYIIASDSGKKSELGIKEMYGTRCDLENVEQIYRMKRFGFRPDDIRKFIFDKRNKISVNTMNKMIEAENPEAVLDIFGGTNYGIYSERADRSNINDYLHTIYYYFIKHFFNYSTDPIISVFSYTTLCEFEIENLFRIIESVRYSLTKEEIEKLVIGYKVIT